MSAILKQLYYGKVSHADLSFAKALELKQLLDTQAQIVEQLETVLNEQQIMQFHTYCNMQEKSTEIEREELFIYAFRLGAKVTAESFLQNEKQGESA